MIEEKRSFGCYDKLAEHSKEKDPKRIVCIIGMFGNNLKAEVENER